MNANDMLDMALGKLEGPALADAEKELASDPEAAETLDRLTRSIARLLDDGDPYPSPPGLARRTIQLVAETRKPKRSILDFVPVAVPFRWADVAVAAGIFVAGLLTLAPAVSRSRDRMDQAGCVYNLQQLGSALWQYGTRHHHYPTGPEEHPSAPTGAFAVMLHDSGALTNLDTLNCPCRRAPRSHPPLPNLDTVCKLHKIDPDRCEALVHTDYAYNVGYRHPSGEVKPLGGEYSPVMPVLADTPDYDEFPLILPGNSPNHGGRGQNVLYLDLHVGFHHTRRLGPNDADMYLNDLKWPAPGLHPNDAALLPSPFPFAGK